MEYGLRHHCLVVLLLRTWCFVVPLQLRHHYGPWCSRGAAADDATTRTLCCRTSGSCRAPNHQRDLWYANVSSSARMKEHASSAESSSSSSSPSSLMDFGLSWHSLLWSSLPTPKKCSLKELKNEIMQVNSSLTE